MNQCGIHTKCGPEEEMHVPHKNSKTLPSDLFPFLIPQSSCEFEQQVQPRIPLSLHAPFNHLWLLQSTIRLLMHQHEPADQWFLNSISVFSYAFRITIEYKDMG